MKLTKNHKILLGLGAVAVVGVILYRRNQKKSSMVNFTSTGITKPKTPPKQGERTMLSDFLCATLGVSCPPPKPMSAIGGAER